MSSRRGFLLACCGALATAGCVGGEETTSSPDQSPTDRTTDPDRTTTDPDRTTGTTTTRRSTATSRIGIRDVGLQSAFLSLAGGIHDDVVARPGEQYVLVWTAEPVDHRRVEVVLDGDPHRGTDDPVSAGGGTPRRRATPVPVPREVDPSEGAIEVGTRSRSLSASALDRLADPPSFDLTDVTVPEQVRPGGQFEVSLSVAHRGGRDGTFLATTSGCSTNRWVVGEGLSAGETVTVASRALSCSGESVEVVVDWRGGPETVSVPVVPATTTA